MRAITTALAAGTGFLIVGCGGEPAAELPESLLARVGATEIHAADLRAEIERRQARRMPVPSRAVLLDELVERAGLLERARLAGVQADPEVRREIENLIIGSLQARELDGRLRAAEVSDEEVRERYEATAESYETPATLRLAILHCRDDRDILERGLEAFRASPPERGRGFGVVAVNHSEHQASRYRGGDLGWVGMDSPPRGVPAEVFEAGLALGELDVPSGVLETANGFFVVMKTGFREGSVRPIEAVEASIRHALLAEKRQAIRERFERETETLAGGVERYASHLDAVELPEISTGLARSETPPALPK